MQPFVLAKGRLRKTTINALLAASIAGLTACAALNGAEAAKGGGSFSAGTWRAATPSPSPVVRDHRGQPQTGPAPASNCKRGRCYPTYTDQSRIHDHRTR
jgi:hypothetical protein